MTQPNLVSNFIYIYDKMKSLPTKKYQIKTEFWLFICLTFIIIIDHRKNSNRPVSLRMRISSAMDVGGLEEKRGR